MAKTTQFQKQTRSFTTILLDDLEKLLEYLHSFSISSPVAVACSGGVDSMFLAYALSKMNLRVYGLVVNHNLQNGSEAVAKRTSNILEQWGVEPVVLEWHHEKIIKGIEEKARLARYGLICDFCSKFGVRTVFLGHHIDDKIETFFMQSVRGVGLRGLVSLRKAVNFRGVQFLRPMVTLFEKKSILQEAKKLGIVWFEDRTNQDFAYTRNWFRGHLNLTLEQKMGILNTIANVEENFEFQRAEAWGKIKMENFACFSFCVIKKQEVWLFLSEILQKIFPFCILEVRRQSIANFWMWFCGDSKKMTLCGAVFHKIDEKVVVRPEIIRLKAVFIKKKAIWNEICEISVNLPCNVVPLGLVGFSVKKKLNILQKFEDISHFPVFMQGENILAIPHLQIHCDENFKVKIHEN